MAAITKLAAEDMMAVAETGRPPALAEIVDVDLADFPEHHVSHPQYERRKIERKKFLAQNAANAERRRRLTYRAWTRLFESIRSCCMARAPLLAFELFELCALEARGIPGGYFDGPRAWSIVTLRIEGETDRTESDKQFYLTALEMQKGNPYRTRVGNAWIFDTALLHVPAASFGLAPP